MDPQEFRLEQHAGCFRHLHRPHLQRRQQVSVACGQPLQLRKKTGSMFISLALTQYMAGMSCQISMPRRSAWW